MPIGNTADTPAPATHRRAISTLNSDELLLARLKAGDDHALKDVWTQLGGYVYGLARRVTCSEEAAREIAQEVFVLLWQRPERVDLDRGGLRAYLGVVTHRRSVDHVRSEERRRKREENITNPFPSGVPDVAEAAMAVIAAQAVRTALDALPPDQRAAIELAYFGGMTFREVAVAMRIPEGTAKSRLRLGLAKLAQALEPLPAPDSVRP